MYETNNKTANTNANKQSDNEGMALEDKGQGGQNNKTVRIHCHSVRKRAVDPDAISIKAVIDGIVETGLLADDTAKEIESPTFSQEKGSPEMTIITISDE